MRTVFAASAVLALMAGQAHAESSPVTLPAPLPAKVEEVKAGWAYVGDSIGQVYVQPTATTVKGNKQVAWDAVFLATPMEVNGRLILGYYYIRQYDCPRRQERVLGWARLADKDVRWNQTRPTPWVVYDLLMGDANIKRFETICGRQE